MEQNTAIGGGGFPGSGFGIDAGRYIRGVVKSPQFGLILAKGACSDLTGFDLPAKTCE